MHDSESHKEISRIVESHPEWQVPGNEVYEADLIKFKQLGNANRISEDDLDELGGISIRHPQWGWPSYQKE